MSSDQQERRSPDFSQNQRGRQSQIGIGYNDGFGYDPRSSSAHSLAPSLPEYEDIIRRRLLVVYLHGFMGNDSSFQSFPAHVHRYLKIQLSETHVIHSKVYPKYKTYKAIEVARDNLSRWLQPHESPTTDIILVGHSMGGLLSADLVLMPSTNHNSASFFQHRILGTVNLDAPLLGLHPGIIVSGISSLFRPKEDSLKSYNDSAHQEGSSQTTLGLGSPDSSMYSDGQSMMTQSSQSSFSSLSLPSRMTFDPNFNPEYPNDVRIQDRGWWKNVVHFVQKHNSEGLVDAATRHIMSHLEFGSVLMDLSSLKSRYENLRKLEDVDDIKYHGFPHVPPRVRFVQYYTVCYGFPKKAKESKAGEQPRDQDTLQEPPVSGRVASGASTPRINVEDYSNFSGQHQQISHLSEASEVPLRDNSDDDSSFISANSLQLLDPDPITDDVTNAEKLCAEFPQESSEPATANSASNNTLRSGSDIVIGDEVNVTNNLAERDEAASGSDTYVGGVAGVEGHPTQKNNPGEVPKEEPETEKGQRSPSRGTAADTAVNSEAPAQPQAESGLADEIAALTIDLPAIPEPPERPTPPDLDGITDKDVRKQVEKEAKRVQKVYDQAVKNRDKAMKERQKIIDKRKKKMASDAEKKKKEEKAMKAAVSDAMSEKESISQAAAAVVPRERRSSTELAQQGDEQLAQEVSRASGTDVALNTVPSTDSQRSNQRGKSKAEKPKKPKKERKFCNLPANINGQSDPKWVKVFMTDVDETAAHTALFLPGPHYEKLVGDVGDMIAGWVQEDATKRTIVEMGT